ncbi:response regulator [Salinarimonas soli]|uniref:Response regulator n=1 Tax=Salinarimonas soli TaxID=1638099 RepID=A0A5B2VBG3_9HYPH|nr:response regulator [Salinarimonas soli]KAA2235995.1 response regulator [Salinarimonas soli]
MDSDEKLVLIVEDNADDRELLSRAFRKAKVAAEIRFAEDGDQALTALKGLAEEARPSFPAVVLLDLKLPRSSGFEVLDWLKRHPTLKRVPVVILTSSQEDTDLGRAYDLGANSYLVKPAKPEALLAMVERIEAYWLKMNQAASLA